MIQKLISRIIFNSCSLIKKIIYIYILKNKIGEITKKGFWTIF